MRFLRCICALFCLLALLLALVSLGGCKPKRLRVELGFLHLEMVPFEPHDASDIRPFALATTELSYLLWYRVRLWAEAELGYEFVHPGAEGSEGKAAAAPRLRRADDSGYSEPVSRISWGDALVWSNALTEYYNHLAQQNKELQGPPKDFLPGSLQGSLPVVYRALDGDILRSASAANRGEYLRSRPSGGFRLPDEREWELAAIHAKRRQQAGLPAGAAYDSEREYHRFSRYARNSNLRSWPSASRAPTQTGLYDMSGNLAEWVEDLFLPDADFAEGEVLLLRTMKGGAYLSPPSELQVSGRLPAMPQQAHKSIGFRVARSLGDSTNH